LDPARRVAMGVTPGTSQPAPVYGRAIPGDLLMARAANPAADPDPVDPIALPGPCCRMGRSGDPRFQNSLERIYDIRVPILRMGCVVAIWRHMQSGDLT
jgi:hypothetical protein